jgi:deazaflavin-dependent oxidoreductase (nitroreductase family)
MKLMKPQRALEREALPQVGRRQHGQAQRARHHVHVKGETLELRARLASAEEKAKVWPVCVEHYPDYALYQARTERDIPVFICEPSP